MTRPRFLADNDINDAIVLGIGRLEPLVDVTRARHIGLGDAVDDVVLHGAARDGLITVSHDVNTMIEAAKSRIGRGEPMSGLILIRQSVPVAVAVEDLILVWSASDLEEWVNRIEFLPL